MHRTVHGAWALLALLASTASAQTADPRALFAEGEVAYQAADYETALARWQQAYALDPRPRLLFNIARAQERLGDLPAAIATLEDFMVRADPADPAKEEARRIVATLARRLAETSLEITGPTGARVVVDGERRGELPLAAPLPVPPGEHEVVVVAGGRRQTFHVVVTPGQQLRLQAEVGPSPVPVLLAAAGGGLAVVSVALGSAAFARSDGAVAGSARARGARRLARATDVIGGAAVATLGAALVWWLVSRRASDDERDSAVSLVPTVAPAGAGGATVGLDLRF